MKKRYLLIIFVTIALILPRVIISINEIIDPFAFSTITLSQLYLEKGEAVIRPFDHPISPWQSHANDLSVRIVAPAFLTILSQVTSISLDTLLYLPINGIIFILLAYVLGLVFSKSRLVAALYAAVVAFEIQVIRATNITFYITLGYSFLIVFLILYLKSLESHSKRGILLLMFCFTTLYFTYYSAEFFAFAFSLSLFMIVTIARFGGKKAGFLTRLGKSYRPFLHLPIAFLVLFVGFDAAVYQFFKMHGGFEPVVSYTGSYISKVLNLAYQILLLIPIGLYLFVYSIKKFTRSKTEANNGSKTGIKPTYLAFIFASMAFSFTYITSFGFTPFSRAFHIFFPLLALYSVYQFKSSFSKRLINYLLTILATLIILASLMTSVVFLFDQMHPYTPKGYSLTSPKVSFLVDHVDKSEEIKVLSSLDIAGYVFYKAMQNGKADIYPFMFGKDVEILYSHDPEIANNIFRAKSYDLLLISREFERRVVFADGWYWAPVATEATSLISNNPGFDRIYDDGQAVIFAYNR